MSDTKNDSMYRRQFLANTASCGAYVAALAALSPLTSRRVFAQTSGDVVAEEKWGRIEKIADNAWALISDLTKQDFTTVCNGGVVAGDRGVLAVESFMNTAGAKWLAEWAEKLTGRWPTDVVVSHFHRDHSAGVAGYENKDGRWPRLWLTEKTESLAKESNDSLELPTVSRVVAKDKQTIDLGNRQVNLHSRLGHTPSDVTVEIVDPNIIFAGDLFFNRMVPNYGDALAKELTAEVAKLKRDANTKYVPGHGPIANAADLKLYREFLDMMEQSVRTAHQSGKEVTAAAAEFKLPKHFENWYIFSDQVMPRAFAAWYRAIESEKKD